MSVSKTLTIIVPCFNEFESLHFFHDAVMDVINDAAFPGLEVEILFINDGSTDSTLQLIKQLADNHHNISYISFSRNFGKEAAIFAGLKAADSEYVALMDADLQDPPDLLPEMYRMVRDENYDCVAARRISRKGEPVLRSFFAHRFYKICNLISDTEIVDGARDFRLMTRPVVDAILSMNEYNRFSKGLFSWVGFSIMWLEYENVERIAGETKWSFLNLLKYSIEGIVAFSVVPLALSAWLGVFLSFVSVLGIITIAIRTLVWGDPVQGWPSLATLISLIGGIQLLCMGIIAQYLSKTYLETKRRPIYIIRETNLRKARIHA